MNKQISRDTWYQVAVAIASAALLILLAIRFPSLPERVPIQFSFGGEVSRTVARGVFAPIFVLVVVLFNVYLFVLRRKSQPIPLLLPVVFIAIGAVVSALSLFA
ncbi:MAG: DUF1648 domain-containing protein [Clostridiaceae bacterium]|nr:DUF1648 domain-containing protein [Clostridiaceae bacterium]